jgi:hypothetical protein
MKNSFIKSVVLALALSQTPSAFAKDNQKSLRIDMISATACEAANWVLTTYWNGCILRQGKTPSLFMLDSNDSNSCIVVRNNWTITYPEDCDSLLERYKK